MTSLNEIQEIATRIVESEGIDLVDIEFKPGRNRSLLRIYIDKEGGVTLNDCENVSRQLGAVLDVKDLLKSAYVLEVSSPGLDRPLQTDRDYRRAIGRILKLSLMDEQGKMESVTGKLLETTEEEVILEEGGRPRNIPRSMVKRAVQDVILGQPKKNRKRK
ncbi:ribosome maturation factor RimP [bacterium]|nr:ribosome maturation factor RimP [bacterium]MCI0604709.1 ribosome maturation factor RimP [bacterium]